MNLESLLRNAHSRKLWECTYWSGRSLSSLTASSNDDTVGTTGPNGSGLPQLGLPLLPMLCFLCFACERPILQRGTASDEVLRHPERFDPSSAAPWRVALRVLISDSLGNFWMIVFDHPSQPEWYVTSQRNGPTLDARAILALLKSPIGIQTPQESITRIGRQHSFLKGTCAFHFGNPRRVRATQRHWQEPVARSQSQLVRLGGRQPSPPAQAGRRHAVVQERAPEPFDPDRCARRGSRIQGRSHHRCQSGFIGGREIPGEVWGEGREEILLEVRCCPFD